MRPVPNPITVITGEQEKVAPTIDNFFDETLRFVEQKWGLLRQNFEIRAGEIFYPEEHRVRSDAPVTDDRVTYLRYGSVVLASVLETRTENNNIRYDFFRHIERVDKELSEFGRLANQSGSNKPK